MLDGCEQALLPRIAVGLKCKRGGARDLREIALAQDVPGPTLIPLSDTGLMHLEAQRSPRGDWRAGRLRGHVLSYVVIAPALATTRASLTLCPAGAVISPSVVSSGEHPKHGTRGKGCQSRCRCSGHVGSG